MRTLKFEQIADSRFVSDTRHEIERILSEITDNLKKLSGVSVSTDPVRTLAGWSNGSHQLRQTYYISKTGRKSTWDDVMDAVNKVSARPYQFI